jgi:hypothetical protein
VAISFSDFVTKILNKSTTDPSRKLATSIARKDFYGNVRRFLSQRTLYQLMSMAYRAFLLQNSTRDHYYKTPSTFATISREGLSYGLMYNIQFFFFESYHPTYILRGSISRPVTPQVETMPLDHAARVRIQKPEVTYDPRKFSVTSRARLPNYLKINFKI